MRQSYFKILGSNLLAVLDLSPAVGMDSNGFIINRVNTPHAHRGKGHAREIMAQCLADADAEGITLYLWINAYGDMSKRQLSAWYKRCGFVNRKGLYTRKPHAGTEN